MPKSIKRFFKWFVPLPVRVYEWGTDRILSTIRELSRRQQEDRRRTEAIWSELGEEKKRADALMKEVREEKDLIRGERKQLEELAASLKGAKQLIQAGKLQADNHRKISEEILWGQIFNNAISGSDWLKNSCFFPGRWAVGYPALYLLYRILNDVRPRRILELGLGETTKMIGQYAASRMDCEHAVVEHDSDWIAFCRDKMAAFSERTRIVHLELDRRAYLDDPEVIVYDRFDEAFAGQQFDLIVIDGPFGGEAQIYARIDILSLLPNCLADSFALVVDDCNRKGEQNMVSLIEKKLEEGRIPYFKGKFAGKKDTLVICSENLKFLRSI